MLVILCAVSSSQAASPSSLVNEGKALYNKGDFPAAAAKFEAAEQAKPGLPETAYNLGTALAAQGEAEGAEASLQKALATQDKRLEEKAKYNLGYNAFMGQDYAKAAAYFKDALALDPEDEDARKNLELALRLAAVTPPPQQQSDKKKQDKSKKQQEDKKEKGAGDQEKGKEEPTPAGGDPDKGEKQDATPPADSKPKDDKAMTKEEAERLLEQMKAQEKDRRRERLRGRSAPAPVERDW